MKCIGCGDAGEGYAVIPGVGDAGEIRFFCDGCARKDRVKMRYWDGRDLDVGGHRDNPDLGPSFSGLIFCFDDFARMRTEDVALVLEWVEDAELAAALATAVPAAQHRVFASLRPDRLRRVRELMRSERAARSGREAQVSIVQTLKRL